MKRNGSSDLPPLDPEIKEAWLRVLERSFGEFGSSGGADTKGLGDKINAEILDIYPDLKDKPNQILNIRRAIMARFFEIVADEPKTPNSKKYDQIIKNFMDESKDKYIEGK